MEAVGHENLRVRDCVMGNGEWNFAFQDLHLPGEIVDKIRAIFPGARDDQYCWG